MNAVYFKNIRYTIFRFTHLIGKDIHMQRVYKGKTKDVYRLNEDQVVLKFKDDVTGTDGVFDPGANTVGLTISGAGRAGLRMSSYFFQKLENEGIKTHFIDADLDEATMTVKDVDMLGNGLEVICRFKAVGSFYRRYGAYCKEGQNLNAFVEVTIKDDERQDPPISSDALEELGILNKQEYQLIKNLTKKISWIIKNELALKNLELYDIKLEFGRDKKTREIILIDEISGGNMRVYRDGKNVPPIELATILFS